MDFFERHERKDMNKTNISRLLSSALAVSLALLLFGCGGGGGSASPAASSEITISGTVAAGVFKNADINIYDASTYSSAATNTPLFNTASDDKGNYSVTLKKDFNKPLLIRALGRADNTASMVDEVFGLVVMPDTFVLEAVVPSSDLTGGPVTAHVTPYTHAMAAFVANKLGRSDIDAAIVFARNSVKSQLTNNNDPLTTSPSSVAMTTLLASVSNIAKSSPSIPTTDPQGCVGKTSNSAKVACTVETLASILQPLASAAETKGTPKVNFNQANALKVAAKNLDVAVVSNNTGMSSSALNTQKDVISEALASTTEKVMATDVDVPDFLKVPDLWIVETMGGTVSLSTGTYVGWSYHAQLCYVGLNCMSVGRSAGYTPEDLMEDPELPTVVRAAVSQTLTELNKVLSALRVGKVFPPERIIKSVISAAIDAGLDAQSVAVGVETAVSGFAGAGYAVPGGVTPLADPNGVTTPAQIEAAKACAADSAYQNPSSSPYDPQLDSNCRLAQFDACIHRETGIAVYDPEGRAACALVETLQKATTGSWQCSYCPYPY